MSLKPAWGEAACEMVKKAAATQSEAVEQLYTQYVEANLFRDEEHLSEINIDKYDDLTLKMNTMASETEKGYKTFLKEVIGDFVKLKRK